MSTREMALSIFNQLNEKQLEGFIAMYNGIFSAQSETSDNNEYAQTERNKAFEEIEQFIKNKITPVSSDFNDRAEYLAYLDERYGV